VLKLHGDSTTPTERKRIIQPSYQRSPRCKSFDNQKREPRIPADKNLMKLIASFVKEINHESHESDVTSFMACWRGQ